MKHHVLTACLLAALGTTVARADDRAGDRAAAERYFRAGSKAYAAQSFAAAAADFDEAYKAMPLPEIAFSAAQAYRRLYRSEPKPEYVRRAVELYRIYLDQVKTGGRVGDAADSLGELQRELDRLGVKATVAAAPPAVEHTRLGVSVTIADPQGAGQATATALREVGDTTGDLVAGLRATLDGKPIEPFALVEVDAREHVIAVAADGYLPAEKHAVAVAGQAQLIELELRPRPATLAIHTDPDATVAIDGRAAVAIDGRAAVTIDGRAAAALDGRGAPGFTLEVPAGKHLVTITRRGREPFGKELVLERGQALALSAPLQLTARRRAVPWVLAGAGSLAASALATAAFALARDSHASDLHAALAAGDQPVATADDYDRTVASRDHFVTATWILGGAAVAAGATGVLLYLLDTPSAESLHLAPVVGPASGGAVLSGHF